MAALSHSAMPYADAALLNSILEASTECSIIAADRSAVIVAWNEGARRLYGYEGSEAIGLPLAALHTAEDVGNGRPFDLMEVALRDGKWEGTMLRVCKDGGTFTARVVLTPRWTPSGAHDGFLLISRDITHEIKVSSDLAAIQAYTRSLIESSIDALATTDPFGAITDVNEPMVALTGRSREELVGSGFSEHFTDPLAADGGIHEAVLRGELTDWQLTARAPDGDGTVVSCNASTFFDRSNVLQGVVVTVRDETERKRFEFQLQDANSRLEDAILAKDRFLASMSHELRTPLNAIIGFTGTLLMEMPGKLNDEQRAQLLTVQANGRHLLSIINDLLDLAKIESGAVELELALTNCDDVVREVADSLRPLAESKGLELEILAPEGGLRVKTDRRALHQILLNLAGNAIKFTERGRVTLEAVQVQVQGQVNGDTVARFRVTDTGPGLPEHERERLFEAFQRLGPRKSGRAEGTGLGLYISKKLADLLNGSIGFETENGRGTTFVLSLYETRK
ncbi:MAG: PAS domain-containing sensor histidine kinase [Gaiellaceae bacterium]